MKWLAGGFGGGGGGSYRIACGMRRTALSGAVTMSFHLNRIALVQRHTASFTKYKQLHFSAEEMPSHIVQRASRKEMSEFS